MTILPTPTFSTPFIKYDTTNLPPNTTIRQLKPLPPSHQSSTQWNPMIDKPTLWTSQIVDLIPISNSYTPARSPFAQGYNGLGSWSIQGFLTVKNVMSSKPMKLNHVAVVLSIGSRGYGSFEKYHNVTSKSIYPTAATLNVFKKGMSVVDSQCIGLLEGCELNNADVEVLFPSRYIVPGEEISFMLTIRSSKSAPIKVTSIHFQVFEHHYHSDPDSSKQPAQPIKIYDQNIKPSNNHDFNQDKTIHTQQIRISEKLLEVQPIEIVNFDGIFQNGKISITHSVKLTIGFLSGGVVPHVVIVEGAVEVVGFSKEVLADVKAY
ncbi:hypothetical protein HDU76_001036 [Blyttiomyces sp. JEL0837]|nr:hypothetical protein HDU76_001036 [Blyttiomyces sp. JEL0837]